jgi:hypothetical protein
VIEALAALMFVLRVLFAPCAALLGNTPPPSSLWFDYTATDGTSCVHDDLVACLGSACYHVGTTPCPTSQ